jgi:hypothetical protein
MILFRIDCLFVQGWALRSVGLNQSGDVFQSSRKPILLSGALGLLLLSGCASEPAKAPPKTANPAAQASAPASAAPTEPAPTYREDEKILLNLITTDILELERKKNYGRIYDNYGSRTFKASISRRDFLRMSHCLENTLGDLVDYDRRNWTFQRSKVKNAIYDSTARPVVRSGGNLTEEIIYVQEGVDFKLNALYWTSNRKDFLACMQTIAQTLTPPGTQTPKPAIAKDAAKADTAAADATAAKPNGEKTASSTTEQKPAKASATQPPQKASLPAAEPSPTSSKPPAEKPAVKPTPAGTGEDD